MRNYLILLLCSLFFTPVTAGEIAIPGEALKESYKLDGPGYKFFYKTGKYADSFSILCEMGQAIPDPKRPNWYNKKPIPGLRFELRARAAILDIDNSIKPMGFIMVTKNGDTLITFKPIGGYENGKWDGDVLSSWSGTETDIRVYSERFGRSGHAYFDLLDGSGFFYKSDRSKTPDYFLSNCRRIRKKNLPVYDWK